MDYPQEISVTAPVSLAIERVKDVLFRPFDMAKWFAIGFCAWLADFGTGGFNNNYKYSSSGGKSGTAAAPDIKAGLAHFRDYLHNNLSWIIPLAIVLFVVILALSVLLLWLHSRGTFMFLHCVAVNRGEVVFPWRKFAREGNSLWLFRLGLGAVGLCLALPLVGVGGWMFFNLISHIQHPDSDAILMLVGIMLLWMCVALVLGIVSFFTKEFVVAIIYLRGGTCMDAWRVFLGVLADNPVRFIIFLLFQIVLGIAMLFVVLAFILCTLCIGGLLLMIPYISTVIMLPVYVFYRSYSLYYLAQYGPEFDVFLSAQSIPPPLP